MWLLGRQMSGSIVMELHMIPDSIRTRVHSSRTANHSALTPKHSSRTRTNSSLDNSCPDGCMKMGIRLDFI